MSDVTLKGTDEETIIMFEENTIMSSISWSAAVSWPTQESLSFFDQQFCFPYLKKSQHLPFVFPMTEYPGCQVALKYVRQWSLLNVQYIKSRRHMPESMFTEKIQQA